LSKFNVTDAHTMDTHASQ